MVKEYLIGVDLGTSSTKAAIYRVNGSKLAEAGLEVPLYHPKPGQVEQSLEDFYLTAAQCVRTCIAQSGIAPQEIAGIAFDSQMAGVGLIDAAFNPVAHFDSWLDMRCEPFIDWMNREAGEQVTALTGCPPTCDHGPKMLWWQHERSDAFQQTAKFVMPGTYVAGKLAGLKADQAFIDFTYIHFSGFSDAVQMQWSDELCDKFGLDREKLPEIVEPWRVVGEVREPAASDFGLAPGTVIAAGAGDTAANALGAGIVRPGLLFDVAGTASVLAGCTDTYVADIQNRALLTMHSVIPGLWNPLAYVGGGGQALRWFRDTFYNAVHGQPQDLFDDLYPEMIAQAAEVSPGCDGLFFSPHMGGRVCPASPNMRGAWVGFSWTHTQAEFFRAILESIGYEYAYYLQILSELLPGLDLWQVFAVGGGARSPIWNQIKANILGVSYQKLTGNEFGTWGAAMIAGKAAGVIDDLALHASRSVQFEGDPVAVDADLHKFYQVQFKKFLQMQSMLDEFYN